MSIIRSTTPADWLTIANGLIGFLAIMYMLDGAYAVGAILIYCAILLDGIDGRLARLLKKKHEFGRYLDSLADGVSFCFAPAVLLYSAFYELERGSALHDIQNGLTVSVCFMLIGSGSLRLARFAQLKEDKLKHFVGLPTPAFALFAVTLYALIDRPYFVLAFIGLVSVLMISDVKYPKVDNHALALTGVLTIAFAILSLLLDAPLLRLMAFILTLQYMVVGPFYVRLRKKT